MRSLAQFYQERVLSYPRRHRRRLPVVKAGSEIRVEPGLFGWRVIADRHILSCRSEAEAQFLRFGLELGLEEIEVPADEGYLLEILPELAELKAEIDAVMNRYLDKVSSRQVRTSVRQRVYTRLLRKDGNAPRCHRGRKGRHGRAEGIT
ncbi:MAG: hypothetical protein ABIK54_00745 [candidate division WOR-3 bacterium]